MKFTITLALVTLTAAQHVCAAGVSFRPVPPLPDGSPEISTNWANVTVSPSTEIGPMPQVWSDISQGAETGDPLYYIQMSPRLKEMGARLVRCDPFSDESRITVSPEGKVVIDFSSADAIVDALEAAGAKPVWNLGSVPDAMLDEKERPIPELLDQFVYQVVHHWNVQQRRNIEYLEYWNEPPSLDGPRFAVAVAAAHRADPTIKVGGPAIMGCNVRVLEEAVNYCRENNVDLGFLSFHLYYEMPDGYVQHIRNVEEMLAKYPGMEDLEMLITEWGVDAGLSGSCDMLYNAAYYSSILEAAMPYWPRVRPMHFEFRDGWDPTGPSRDFWGRWGMVTYPHLLPKPVYNAGRMWSMLAPTQVEAQSSDSGVRVVASKGKHEVAILIWSWPESYRRLPDKAEADEAPAPVVPVRLHLDELPFESAGVRYTRYIVDPTHGNALFDINSAEMQQAQDIILARAGREQHEETRTISEGAFEAELMLPLHSVTLIVLRPEERPPVNLVARADRFNIWAGEKAEVVVQPRFDEQLDVELLTDPANRSPFDIEVVNTNPLTLSVEAPVAPAKSMRYLNLWLRNKTSGALGKTALEFQSDTPAYLKRAPDHIDASPVTLSTDFALEIVNKTPDARTVELAFQTPEGLGVTPASSTVRLEPGSSAEVTLTATFDPGMRPDRYHATALLISGGRQIHSLQVPVTLSLEAPHARQAPVIDGDLSDWEGVPQVTAASEADFDGFLRKSWGGPGDISGTAWARWDQKNLYFAFRVRDNQHIQHLTTWEMKNYDSVHLGMDLGRDSTNPDLFFDQGDCDYVFGLLGDTAHVYRHWGAQRSMDFPEGVQVAARKDGDTITFEVAMDWEKEFIPFARPEAGEVIGTSVYFLDYDKEQYPSEMRWGRGLHWHTMRPALFNSIRLTEQP